MSVEEQEAAIIRRVYNGVYAHSENVLWLLRQHEQMMSTDQAIGLLYRRLVEEQD